MRPAVLEALLWSTLAFGPLAFGSVEPWSLALLEAGIFSLALLIAFRRGPAFGADAHRTLLPAVLAIIGLGLAQSLHPAPVNGPIEHALFTASADGTAHALLLWAAFAALVWAVPLIVRDKAAFHRLAWAVFLTGAFIAFVGILQRAEGNHFYYGLRRNHQGTAFGPYTNYNHAACMLNVSLFLGLGLFLSRFRYVSRHDGIGRLSEFAATQTLMAFLLGLILSGIVMTHSRGGALAASLSFLAVGSAAAISFLSGRKRLAAGAAIGAGAVALAAAIAAFPSLIGFVHGSLDDSSSYRVSMFRSAFEMLRTYPLFGVGLGGFMEAFPYFQERYLVGIVDHLHDSWLSLAVQTGLVGFLAFATGLAGSLWRSARAWAASTDFETRCLAGGAFAGVLAFLVHDLVEFNFEIPGNAVLFLTLVASLSFLSKDPAHEPLNASSRFPRRSIEAELARPEGAS